MRLITKIIDTLEKAKYIKREGTPGNYKYYYDNGDDPTKGEGKDLHYHIKQAAAHSVESGKDSDAFKYHKEQAKKLSGDIKLNEKNLDSTIDAYGKIHSSDKEKNTPTRDKIKAEKESNKEKEPMKEMGARDYRTLQKLRVFVNNPGSLDKIKNTVSTQDLPKGIPEISYKELFAGALKDEDLEKENDLSVSPKIKTPSYYIIKTKEGRFLATPDSWGKDVNKVGFISKIKEEGEKPKKEKTTSEKKKEPEKAHKDMGKFFEYNDTHYKVTPKEEVSFKNGDEKFKITKDQWKTLLKEGELEGDEEKDIPSVKLVEGDRIETSGEVSYMFNADRINEMLGLNSKKDVKKSGTMVGDSLIKSDFDDFMVKELKK